MTKLKILHLEDNRSDAELIDHCLKKSKMNYEIKVVNNRSDFKSALKYFDPDVILSDHSLPQFDSTEALTIAKVCKSGIPFILVTGAVSEEFAITCLKNGSDDYILKKNLTRIPVAIAQVLKTRQAEREKSAATEKTYNMNQLLKIKAEKNIIFQKTLLDLASSQNDKLENRIKEIVKADSHAMGIERVSVWLYNEKQTAIHCECLYLKSRDAYEKGGVLESKDFPSYFSALEKNRVIAADDAHTHSATFEFSKIYLTPLDIFSMMDVPIRLGGKIIGVVCHEQTQKQKKWIEEEQLFASTIADLVSLAIESTERKKAEEQMRNFARHLNQLIEDERTHLAREIHDELGQQLAGLKFGLEALSKAGTPSLPEGSETQKKEDKDNSSLQGGLQSGIINDLIKDVDHTIQSMRKIATELRPGILDTLGLIPSIEWLLAEFEKKAKIKIRLELNIEDHQFEKNISTCLFRICQEALTNILKHAEASEVNIQLTRNAGELIMKIHDNGKGISTEKLRNPFSMGLLGMRERANGIGAELKIESEKGKGTTVYLKNCHFGETKTVTPPSSE